MANLAVNKALKQLHIEHYSMGKMLGELDLAVRDLDGSSLSNAIDDICHRYGFDLG